MLGKGQLSVLRRLRDEGVIREKLHIAVNGLITEGYVNQDDGYMLTEKGAAVVHLYDDLTDNERELLMRMYRAYVEKRTFTVDEDTGKCAGGLIIAGLVDGSSHRLVLTQYALDAWRGWAEFWNMKHKRHQETYRNKRKALAPTKPIAGKVKPFSGNGTLPEESPDMQPVSNGNSDVPIAPTPPPVDSSDFDALEHCDTCAGCIDHEILHMLAEKYPAIAQLRQTVLETRRLMDELNIGKK